MLYVVLIIVAVLIGGYFAFRYFTILYAFKQIIKEMSDIQQDISQNQVVHLPIPNRHLGKVLTSFNTILEEIRKERQKYEKREKEFQRQIENISHDLRTPLTVILGYLNLISKSNKEDIELVETIDIIKHKADIMKNLVTQFYDFSRLNAGDYQVSLNSIDVSRMLREFFMGNYQVLEQAHLQMEVDIPQHPIWVLGEEAALERIFLNLFQNAGRYADTYFHISIKECKQKISILFINDTRVLTENDIDHLFERFYMHDYFRNQEGTGLGLTVAKSLAEEMGAKLNAYTLSKDSASSKIDTLEICFELCLKVV